MADLTNKQRAFIEEYLADFNGTRAAQRAGYKGNDVTLSAVASENLRKPRIAKKIAERFQAKIMTADEVLSRLSGMARADISEFVTDTGAIDWDAVRDRGYLVKKIAHYKGKQSVIELHDAQSALQLVGKHLRLFVERTENVDLTSLTIAQLERISAGEDVLSVLATPGKSRT